MRHQLLGLMVGFLLIAHMPVSAQSNQTANDYVKPYNGHFGYGTNVGYYPRSWGGTNWTVEQLGDLAIGNEWANVPGAGVTTLRPSLPQWFQEQWGYDFRVRAFEHYKSLGAKDHVVFLSDPSREDRDPIQHCPGEQSAMFKNMYEPIWDNGENGTPINENNIYAAYVYKTVSTYKDYVKFWEVWNEPDFTRHGNYFDLRENEGNWWDNNPAPCSYKLRAPIFDYIRLLRISYEVIKSVDEDAYVAIGGLGYPSFLDAVLRNTDNPHGGGITGEHPLKGGAYFDVMSYHTYPHIDGSLRIWNDDRTSSTWKRNTDMAVDGVLSLYHEFDDVLKQHGYNGSQYPVKEWIITESQAPRKPLRHDWGSDAIQVNFIIKALVEAQRYNMRQFHVYTIGDKKDYNQAYQLGHEYELMGFYKNLNKAKPFQQQANDVTLAHKTTSDLLYGKRFDHEAFNQLNLPESVRGGVFKGDDGKRTYVLWAKITGDRTENANQNINLKQVLGNDMIQVKQWDFCKTKALSFMSSSDIHLTGRPIFFTAINKCASSVSVELKNPSTASCHANNGGFDIVVENGTPNYSIYWTGGGLSGRETIDGNWYSLRNVPSGYYNVVVMDANGCGANANINVTEGEEDCSNCDNFSIQAKNPVSNCGTGGKFDVSIAGGNGNMYVEWSGEQSGSRTISGRWLSIPNLSDGNYTVKVIDANGCTDYANISLECSCTSVAYDIKDVVAANCGASNGKFDVAIRGNRPNFNIKWTGPRSGNVTRSGMWYSVRNIPTGNYTVTVKDATNCAITKNVYVPETGCGANMPGTDDDDLEDRGTESASALLRESVELNIFPNPTNGVFYTDISTEEDTDMKLEVLDAVGRVIAVHQVQNVNTLQHQFDLINQQNGIYFIRLTTDSTVRTKPIALVR